MKTLHLAAKPAGHPFLARPFAFAVIVLLALGTALAGNHCLLGGMKPAAAAQHSCCEKTARTHPSPTGPSACCASLAAPVPGQATAPSAATSLLTHGFWIAWISLPPATEPEFSGLSARAHDPPGSLTFCELVLSRTLPAHAPPSFVA